MMIGFDGIQITSGLKQLFHNVHLQTLHRHWNETARQSRVQFRILRKFSVASQKDDAGITIEDELCLKTQTLFCCMLNAKKTLFTVSSRRRVPKSDGQYPPQILANPSLGLMILKLTISVYKETFETH